MGTDSLAQMKEIKDDGMKDRWRERGMKVNKRRK